MSVSPKDWAYRPRQSRNFKGILVSALMLDTQPEEILPSTKCGYSAMSEHSFGCCQIGTWHDRDIYRSRMPVTSHSAQDGPIKSYTVGNTQRAKAETAQSRARSWVWGAWTGSRDTNLATVFSPLVVRSNSMLLCSKSLRTFLKCYIKSKWFLSGVISCHTLWRMKTSFNTLTYNDSSRELPPLQ